VSILVGLPSRKSRYRFLFQLLVKRGFDIVAAALGLVLLCALFLTVAILIKLDSRGPIVIRLKRRGHNSKTIRILKFRTTQTEENDETLRLALGTAPRMTRVGHILRRSDIDALPQLVNVLRGEMSIVGPRPWPVAQDHAFARPCRLSLGRRLRPGLTGWAQVNGHNSDIDTPENMLQRVKYDLEYLDNWSLGLDFKIMIATLSAKW